MNNYELSVCEYLKQRNLVFYKIADICKTISPIDKLPLKNFDVLISGTEYHLLVEIKGRKASGKTKVHLENWVSGEDISSLLSWQQFFGTKFKSIICFVYQLTDDLPTLKIAFSEFKLANLRFALFGIPLDDYISKSTLRSIRWNTFSIKSSLFMKSIKPFTNFIPKENHWINPYEII